MGVLRINELPPPRASTDRMESGPERPPVVDFVGGAVGHRLQYGGGGRNQALARSVGLARDPMPTIVDATAGLGRDAFLLACEGAHIVLLERSPAVQVLLRDGLERARAAGPELAAVVARMTLIQGDARSLLPGLRPDVVLVDPMHPPRNNTALVKKDMRLLRELVGPDSDALELMQVALASATKRVVLKWPRLAAAMPGLRDPSHRIIGKTVRYDVFMIPAAGS